MTVSQNFRSNCIASDALLKVAVCGSSKDFKNPAHKLHKLTVPKMKMWLQSSTVLGLMVAQNNFGLGRVVPSVFESKVQNQILTILSKIIFCVLNSVKNQQKLGLV